MKAAHNFRDNLQAVLDAGVIRKSTLASTTGKSRSYLDSVLKGHVTPSIDACETIAVACGYTLVSMLQEPAVFEESLMAIAAR